MNIPALRTAAPLEPAVTRRLAYGVVFRGRMGVGTALLPAHAVSGSGIGITFGLAVAPVILKSLGGSFQVPANVPWAIPSDGTWRLVTTQDTDLRLIHEDVPAGPGLIGAQRAVRWEGNERAIVRSAIRVATPDWVDDQHRQIHDLAAYWSVHQRTMHAVPELPDPDFASAFLMMSGWAIAQQRPDTDQRFARVVDHIEQRIADPALTTASVVVHSRLSRRTLQSLFSSHGGVAAYIRRQRLARVIRHLTADAEVFPDLDAVARATGLGSRRTLERTVHKVYGLTPLQARAHVLDGGILTERGDLELRAS